MAVTILLIIVLKLNSKFDVTSFFTLFILASLISWLTSKRWELLQKSSYIPLSPTAVLFVYTLASAVQRFFYFLTYLWRRKKSYRLGYPVMAVALSLSCGMYAFGSNSGFYRAMADVFVFVVCAVLLIVEKRISTRVMVCVLLLVAIPLGNILHYSELNPYRTAPIHEATLKFSSTGDFAGLFVDVRTYSFLKQMERITDENGWVEGDTIIDLTRFSPGLVFFLGASTPSDVLTTVGQYAGTDKLINRALSSMSRKVQCRAWVMTSSEEFSPVTKNKKICGSFFPSGLFEAGTITWWVNNETITIWRPQRLTDS